MTALAPKVVFVPFEWDVKGDEWIKRDDLPRFKETEETGAYIRDHPEISHRGSAFVILQWVECWESWAINEYLRGIGSSEQTLVRH